MEIIGQIAGLHSMTALGVLRLAGGFARILGFFGDI